MVNTMKYHYFLMLTGKYASRVTKYCSDCFFIQKKLADVITFAVIPVIYPWYTNTNVHTVMYMYV